MPNKPQDLPELAGDYSISKEQAAEFQRDGHILLRNLATPLEIADYRKVILEAREKYGQEATPLEQRDTYGKAFLKGMNLWPKDEGVAKFVLSRRFAKVAADLLGVNGVRVYHDQALLKEPGGGLTPWHQDQHYWPLDTDNTITLWMPLVDIPEEIGSMTFGSGSHRLGYLGDLAISETSDTVLANIIREKGITTHHDGAMSAGDATYHSGWTLHSAPGNPTPNMREVMTIIYFADGTRAGHADNANRANDLAGWLPGIKPGELAASPLNPVVYSR